MKGGIYSREKCQICGQSLKFNERKELFVCPNHKQVSGSGKCLVRFGKDINKSFTNTKQAIQFLYGLRFKTVEGTYDPKDYQASKPYSFTNLSDKYLKRKQTLKSFKDKKRHIKVAQDYFQDRNVKEITGADIEDYLFSIESISEKTRHNYKSSLHDFWNWILQRGVINRAQIPIFPEIQYELAYRTITDMKTQEAIIEKVFEISHKINPKIWFGIDLLSTYVNLRPGDLLKIKEKDIDLKNGVLTIYFPTKSKNKIKTVRLLDQHIESFIELKKEFPALPEVIFFRHHGGIKCTKPNQPFGAKYFKKWWDKACIELGVENLDLYGGTRHTTTTEIARRAGTENARKASAHETNKAFDRYCQFQDETAFNMAKIVKGCKNQKGLIELKYISI